MLLHKFLFSPTALVNELTLSHLKESLLRSMAPSTTLSIKSTLSGGPVQPPPQSSLAPLLASFISPPALHWIIVVCLTLPHCFPSLQLYGWFPPSKLLLLLEDIAITSSGCPSWFSGLGPVLFPCCSAAPWMCLRNSQWTVFPPCSVSYLRNQALLFTSKFSVHTPYKAWNRNVSWWNFTWGWAECHVLVFHAQWERILL